MVSSQNLKRSGGRSKSLAATTRWLHIYLSMLGLIALLFFSVTGITVNHPDWFFSGSEHMSEFEGTIPKVWLGPTTPPNTGETVAGADKLAIVEHFRNAHKIGGAVSEFSKDDYQIMVGFNGPGYTAYATIELEDGSYTLTETSQGFVAVMNDLHKGRDTGAVWSWVIDISAIIMITASLSGLYLLLGLRNRKRTGLIIGTIGGTLLLIIYLLWIP